MLRFWFPLATSWLLMSAETPVVTAAMARMEDAKLHLAAFGIAFSLILVLESPIIALLTAGNALARDRRSFQLVRRFMLFLSAVLTVAVLALGHTPLFHLTVLDVIGAPPEVAELIRPVLWTMTLWPAAIGYRRFHQGLMIRHGHTRQVSYGTAIRLVVTLGVSLAGLAWGRLGGATVAGLALACAVIAEAAYIHIASRVAVRTVMETRVVPGQGSLAMSELLRFYAPLALTSMVLLSTTPLLNYGMARSPWAVESLAVWPVVNGILFILRSFGYSLQEVVIALLDGVPALRMLRRFAFGLGVISLLLTAVLAFTPLGLWWLERISGLDQELTVLAVPTLRWALLLPGLSALQSWLRGVIVQGRSTGAIAWATAINLVTLVSGILLGIQLGLLPGAILSALALTSAQVVESIWLWLSARSTLLYRSLTMRIQSQTERVSS